ncbi:hypothetical protein Tco_0721797 [Tanacetum coccineum]
MSRVGNLRLLAPRRHATQERLRADPPVVVAHSIIAMSANRSVRRHDKTVVSDYRVSGLTNRPFAKYNSKEWNSGDDQLRLRWIIYLVGFWADAAERRKVACVINFGGSYQLSIQCAPFEALYGRKCRSPILWAERLVGMELRLPKELNNVHDTFHVSNLKKCLADANLHMPLDKIKVDKTLRFVEEPVEIMDREIRKLKHRKVVLVKVRCNSKRGPEFTWEREDQMRIKYPQLFVDRVVEPAS